MDRRCCCRKPRGCLICWDNFDRPNSDSILPFIEKTGDWSIDGNRLKEAGGNDGLAYCPTKHPVETWTAVAHVTLVNMEVGNEYILFVNYDPVSGGFEGIKFVCDDENTGTLSIIDHGVSLSNIPYGDDGELTISLCRNLNAIWGENGKTDGYVYSTVERIDAPGRRYAGVKNPGENAVYFDNFRYEEHHATNADCDQCPCTCGVGFDGGADYTLPRKLLVTLEVTGDDAPEWLDGETFEIELSYANSGEILWYGEGSLPDCSTGSGSYLWKLSLYCRGTTPKWELVIENEPCIGGTYGREILSIVCDPIVLAFGPWHIISGDDAFVNAIITEMPA